MFRESSTVSFAVEFPAHWRDMKQQNLCVVQLLPADPEYNTVASKFNETCSSFVIEKVSLLLMWSSLRVEISDITVLYKYSFSHFLMHLILRITALIIRI
jgi:hypothetical protein